MHQDFVRDGEARVRDPSSWIGFINSLVATRLG
jgi:hypothetical protein